MSDYYDNDLPDFDDDAAAIEYGNALLEDITLVVASGDAELMAQYEAALDANEIEFLRETRHVWEPAANELAGDPEFQASLYDGYDSEDAADVDPAERAQMYDDSLDELQKAHPAVQINRDAFNVYVAEAEGDMDAAFEMYKDAYARVGKHGHGATMEDAIAVLHDNAYTTHAESKYGLPAVDVASMFDDDNEADYYGDDGPRQTPTSLNAAADAMFADLYGSGGN